VTKRKAIEHRISALMERAEEAFTCDDGVVRLPRVVTVCVEDCWIALCRDHAYERAERLLEVAAFLVTREQRKMLADPKRWLQRQQEMAAA
jgi:hypothetical protein